MNGIRLALGAQVGDITRLALTLLLMAIALFACYMPARYASRINPIETLRAE